MGITVLIIEDNHDLADSLGLLLQLAGHEVRVAYTGDDGLRAAFNWVPDVVLADIGLPELNGFEVASRIRQNPATAKMHLIAITGYGSEQDRRRAFENGFDQHLTKPADPAVLLRLLEQVAPTR